MSTGIENELEERNKEFYELLKYIDIKSYESEISDLKSINNHSATKDKNRLLSNVYNALSQKDPAAALVNLRPDYFGDRQLSDFKEYCKALSTAYVRTMHGDGEPAVLSYNQFSGLGSINGTPIRVRGTNKKIFTLLSNNVNRPLDKGLVWRTAGHRGKPTSKNDVVIFNTYITNLRRSLGGISPKQLRLEKSLVELWAVQSLTD